MMEREPRAKEEIYKRIRVIQTAWREMGTIGQDVQETMQENLMGQLEALYWCLGYSTETALDNASIALGGDPIDWS